MISEVRTAKTWTLTRGRREAVQAYILIVPSLIVTFAIIIFPTFYLFIASVHRWKYGVMRQFIGLKNFYKLFNDVEFVTVFWNTVVYTFSGVAAQLVMGMAVALLLHRARRWEGLLRVIVLMPFMVSMVAGSVTFKWMLNTEFGVVNYLLMQAHLISRPVNWLGEPALAMFSCIAVATWAHMPFVMLILLAGLKSIPEEIYESAQIDGANALQRYAYLTVPLLVPAIFVCLLIRTMFSFRDFDIPYSLTFGGPGIETKLLAMQLQEKMTNLAFGYNAALSIVMVAVTMLVCYFYIKVMRVELRD